MKGKTVKIVLIVFAILAVVGAGIGGYLWWRNSHWPGKPTQMQMHVDFPKPQNLADGNGERVKVILLMGQSNATGVGHIEYLQKNTTPEQYARYEAGFDSVLINFSLDNNHNSSKGEFTSVDLGCSILPTYFGPEVGMAERFSEAWGDEKVIILKYTYSGTSLYYQWLAKGERGSIYGAMKKFVDMYMNALRNQGYDARLGAVCWMQGESDAASDIATKWYYRAQSNFISYLREDFAKYAEEGGICFIDAGISDSGYWKGYQTVNTAKEKIASESNLNYYFSTIDAGLTYQFEPAEKPDMAHYDSLSTLKLGHLFGEFVIRAYKEHNK